MDVESVFANVKELVRSVLSENVKARGDDTFLYIECCKKLGANSLDDLLKLPLNSETVTRARRIIQNKEGECLPSKEMLEIREERQNKIRNYFRNINKA